MVCEATPVAALKISRGLILFMIVLTVWIVFSLVIPPSASFEKVGFLDTSRARLVKQGFRDQVIDYQISTYKSTVALDEQLARYDKELLPKGYSRSYPNLTHLYARYVDGKGNAIHVIQGFPGSLTDDLEPLVRSHDLKPDLYSDVVLISRSRPAGLFDKLAMSLHHFGLF
jgi:hypothetical protein